QDNDKQLSLGELAHAYIWRHGGEPLLVKGSWDPETVEPDDTLYGNVAPTHSFAAQAVEVEVDTETGQVTVIDSFLSDDLGKVLNLHAVHGQANGANAQAIGWALYEDLRVTGGRIEHSNFADYTMPTSTSLPMLRGDFIESDDPEGP